MILVDSSVWVDFLRGTPTPQAEWLDRHLGDEALVMGDLILAEVLRGITTERAFDATRRRLASLEQLTLGGDAVAVEAARNHRRLRSRGVTVRGTVDLIIATRCLLDGLLLLHDDRDFEPFERHLGLQTVNWQG